MKPSRSFRSRLSAGFLLASLLPMALCSAMLLQIFRLRLESQADTEAREQLIRVERRLGELYDSFCRTAQTLEASTQVGEALARSQGGSTGVYNDLYAATEGARENAQFDLFDREGRGLYSTGKSPVYGQLSTQWGTLYAAEDAQGFAFTQVDGGEGEDAPLLLGSIPLKRDDGQTAGYLVVSLTRGDFRRMLGGLYGSRNDLLILNAHWRSVYATRTELETQLAPLLRQRLLGGLPLGQEDGEYDYRTAFQEEMGLYVVLRMPQILNGQTRGLLTTVTAGSALVCVVLSVLMSLRLSRQMFRPIQRLQNAIGQVEHNNLDVYVTPGQDDELGQLARRFNGMVGALKRNQEQLVENQRELNQAQIRMLQAQLNPHFLCNTLDTMKWIGKIHQVPQVALMAANLGDILRFCISREEFVPISREVEILRRYMEIQSIRLSGRCSLTVELPGELEGLLVPRMILQPIVENAVLHGLPGVENGVVQVKVWKEGDRMKITVTDNGRGLPEEWVGPYTRPGTETGGHHLGLYNVDTILKKYYGEEFGLYLDRRPDGPGTVVTAVLLCKEEPVC